MNRKPMTIMAMSRGKKEASVTTRMKVTNVEQRRENFEMLGWAKLFLFAICHLTPAKKKSVLCLRSLVK